MGLKYRTDRGSGRIRQIGDHAASAPHFGLNSPWFARCLHAGRTILRENVIVFFLSGHAAVQQFYIS